jgi:hypothetical protein
MMVVNLMVELIFVSIPTSALSTFLAYMTMSRRKTPNKK